MHTLSIARFPDVGTLMMATPVIVMCLEGKDVVSCVRAMTGATNCRAAAPGTIRGDMGMSGQENIIHASDTPENAAIEIKRFFRDGEIFEYTPAVLGSIYAADEMA